jgi:hypothetical protein
MHNLIVPADGVATPASHTCVGAVGSVHKDAFKKFLIERLLIFLAQGGNLSARPA